MPKRRSPNRARARASVRQEIYDAGEILYPDIIMVYHPDVIVQGKSYTMPFFSGIKRDGVILVNSNKPLDFSVEENERLRDLNVKVHFFPATETARELVGTDLSTNVAMLGALLGVTEIVSFDALSESLRERFGGSAKFVASGTTAVLDDAVKAQYGKIEKLIAANTKVLEETYRRASAAVAADTRG